VTGMDPLVPRRSRTPSAGVARELLSAAEDVLVKDGVAGLTVRAVSAAAGVAPMGVYNQFGGKAGLLAALLRRGFDRLREAIDADDESDPVRRLRCSCLRYREFAVANPRLYAVLFEQAIFTAGGRDECEEHVAACFGVLARNVDLAVAAGALAPAGTRETAQQIWGVLHGAVSLELKGLVLTPDPAATYRALVDTIVRGLARPAPAEEGYFRDGTAGALA
jgi:AcrR family transcriptional regulator